MRVTDPLEVLMLLLMYRWERTAPADQHQGVLGGEPARNTQAARLAHVLKNISVAGGGGGGIYETLSLYTRRKDGQSYVSQDSSWMKQPMQLSDGWFFEGCTSLPQKQAVLHQIGRFGYSGEFEAAAEDFVAGKSIEAYLPTEHEEGGVLVKLNAKSTTNA